jgi:hypothetical protein
MLDLLWSVLFRWRIQPNQVDFRRDLWNDGESQRYRGCSHTSIYSCCRERPTHGLFRSRTKTSSHAWPRRGPPGGTGDGNTRCATAPFPEKRCQSLCSRSHPPGSSRMLRAPSAKRVISSDFWRCAWQLNQPFPTCCPQSLHRNCPFPRNWWKRLWKKGWSEGTISGTLVLYVRTHIMSRSSRIVVDLARQATANGVQW